MSHPACTSAYVAGGMNTKTAGRPLGERPGPVSSPDAGDTSGREIALQSGGVAAPPGTPCWIKVGDLRVPGVVLSWQQGSDGQWHALVSCWLPVTAISKRS